MNWGTQPLASSLRLLVGGHYLDWYFRVVTAGNTLLDHPAHLLASSSAFASDFSRLAVALEVPPRPHPNPAWGLLFSHLLALAQPAVSFPDRLSVARYVPERIPLTSSVTSRARVVNPTGQSRSRHWKSTVRAGI